MLTWIPSPSPLDNVQFKNGKKISPFKSSHPLPSPFLSSHASPAESRLLKNPQARPHPSSPLLLFARLLWVKP